MIKLIRQKIISDKSGLSLTEIMVTVAIITIAFMALMGAFLSIAKSTQQSKFKSLASNLAQEKMQVLRQVSYYRLMSTISPLYSPFYPTIAYDNLYYPPEQIYEGGVRFERYVYVRMLKENQATKKLETSTTDKGIKEIQVAVVWTSEGENKLVVIRSIKANPDTVMANAFINGTVRDATTANPIEDATVTLAEDQGSITSTDSNGKYDLDGYPGSYVMYCYAKGYYSQNTEVSVAENQTITQDFNLSQISSGTVFGTVWVSTNPLISQVVASTVSPTGADQEYIELYNPTTNFVPVSGGLDIVYQEGIAFPSVLTLNYVNSGIPVNSYYLISNTSPVTIAGSTKAADAIYDALQPSDTIKSNNFGSVGIRLQGQSEWLDCIGWRDNISANPSFYEKVIVTDADGLGPDEQYVRRTSTAGVVSGFGRAYDCGSNNIDFIVSTPTVYLPKNTTDTELAIAGTPAIGAIVSGYDGLSSSVNALDPTGGTLPYAEFYLNDVATGTWNVLIASGIHSVVVTTVTLNASGDIVGIPNDVTDPLWVSTGSYSCILSTVVYGGYIAGTVKNALGLPITPAIIVNAATAEAVYASESDGSYILSCGTGTLSVVANEGNANPQYISVTIPSITLAQGELVTGVDFILSEGGSVEGWVTRDGTNPQPNISLALFDNNGQLLAQEISKADGFFKMVNVATGTQTVEPILDTGESSTPVTANVNVISGSTVFVGTFTVTGAFGYITGSLTDGGKPISSGLLLVASANTISSLPTIDVNSATLPAIYTANSYEDGTYSLEVRGSTSTAYYVYAYYPQVSGSGVTVSTGTQTGIMVGAAQTTSGVDFSW
ncbi:carboxypeptidase regulatory-like domain-containing protein [Elusimicrobiota bacterium]